MSDLHLEVFQEYAAFDIQPHAPRLVLAGDIGRFADYEKFRDFLRSVCQKFEEVYLVLGNHEFFGASQEEGLRRADEMQQEPGLKDKLIVMNQKRVDLGDVTILGCTLHSKVPPEAEEIVRNKVGDFRHIRDWTVANHNAAHAADVKWLEEEIACIRQTESGLKRKIVVISHHAPAVKGTSKPIYEGSPWSSAFATDLIGTEERSCLDEVQWWIFGHTHYSTDRVCGRVRLVSNQRGYVFPNEKKNAPRKSLFNGLNFWANSKQEEGALFKPDMVIEV